MYVFRDWKITPLCEYRIYALLRKYTQTGPHGEVNPKSEPVVICIWRDK